MSFLLAIILHIVNLILNIRIKRYYYNVFYVWWFNRTLSIHTYTRSPKSSFNYTWPSWEADKLKHSQQVKHLMQIILQISTSITCIILFFSINIKVASNDQVFGCCIFYSFQLLAKFFTLKKKYFYKNTTLFLFSQNISLL